MADLGSYLREGCDTRDQNFLGLLNGSHFCLGTLLPLCPCSSCLFTLNLQALRIFLISRLRLGGLCQITLCRGLSLSCSSLCRGCCRKLPVVVLDLIVETL